MRLARLTVLLILAAFLAVEPVVHTHPLRPANGSDGSGLSSPNICAICAVGADSAVLDAPVVITTAVIVDYIPAPPLQPITAEARVPLASRAPPAA